VTNPPVTPLLDTVRFPSDLKAIDDKLLPQLAEELRAEMIDAVSRTGGHLGAGLGVVELTIAIHKVFDTPHDRLIFDVGHQCYPHKILTGRRDRIRTLRQEGGLSASPSARKASMTISARAFLDLDFRRPRHGGGERAAEHEPPRHLGNRRRRDVGRHGLRGAQQCRRARCAADRDPQRQRHVDRAADRRDERLSGADGVGADLYGHPRGGQEADGLSGQEHRPGDHPRRRACARLRHRRHHVRGARLLSHRADRRSQSRPSAPVLRNVRDNGDGPVLIHVVTQKGKGYAPARGRRTSITAFPSST
jgi:1-deoxy-D-xylulose-5-phosphate synthase